MKRTHVALWFAIVAILLIGCESNLVNPNSPEVTTHHSGSYSLAKSTTAVEFDSSVPSGTVYGYGGLPPLSASGGESVSYNWYTDNTYGSSYEVHLYANVKGSFDESCSITVVLPSLFEYLSTDSTWIGMLYGGTVTAIGVRTDSTGSASVTLNCYAGWDEVDEDG
ncbi:MAG: hypothetical protein K9N38_09035 [Candidatus Marinimicrobia bacterium]|nr:hypothetical protein [Candidatus Neomarinimicrobiota bacterium]MCF7851311.1 hypothetical protein [Candidatus Neomarinimicrobiota bacterium]